LDWLKSKKYKKNTLLISHLILSIKQLIALKSGSLEEDLSLLNKEMKTFHDKLRKELSGCGLDIDLASLISSLIEESKKRLLSA
jgi:hypothetical protein